MILQTLQQKEHFSRKFFFNDFARQYDPLPYNGSLLNQDLCGTLVSQSGGSLQEINENKQPKIRKEGCD